MILKKPYAFFIKNFKLFHFIIFALSAVLLYRTSIVYSFFKEYCKTSPNVIGKNLTSALFSPWLYNNNIYTNKKRKTIYVLYFQYIPIYWSFSRIYCFKWHNT